MSDTPEQLQVDLSGCRGIVWATKCTEALGTDEGLKHMRAFVRRFKRKGGDDGTPGDYDDLLAKLQKATGMVDDEEVLTEL